MKALARNKKTIYYATYSSEAPVYDSHGFYTGQFSPGYNTQVKIRMNVSPARGEADLDQFGINERYDKTLVTTDMDCPITETTRLWIDVAKTAPHDYVVVKVAKSLNSITYAVRKVDVGGEVNPLTK